MERLLWIDAICINQRSVAERNAEVRRMRRIYQGAMQVVVWLGRESEAGDVIGVGVDGKESALMVEASKLTFKLLGILSEVDGQGGDGVLDVFMKTGYVILALQVLCKMFCRPWFLRMWIIQEIALARSAVVALGPQRISWDRFVGAVNALRNLQYGLNDQIWRISGASRAHRIEACRLDAIGGSNSMRSAAGQLIYLLWPLRGSEVTDPRDRLFGILGLIHRETGDRLLEIDYQKPVYEMFRDLSIYLVEHGFLADVLCAVTHKIEHLPHWAALWTAPLEPAKGTGSGPSRMSKSLGDCLAVSRARGSEVAQAWFSEDSRKLTVKGVFIDVVGFASKNHECSKHKETSLEEQLELMLVRLLSWEDEMEGYGPSNNWYETREERSRIWRRAVLHETEDSWLGQQYDRFVTRAQGGVLETIPQAKDSAMVFRLLTELCTTLGDNLDYRKPFITVGGLMGSTGSNCRVTPGDVLCVILGCDMPFLLRPVEGTDGLFRFMTCCFVEGLMDYDFFEGEASSGFNIVNICMV